MMKRTMGITLGAAVLMLGATLAFAEDAPATSTAPATTQAAPAKMAPATHHAMKHAMNHTMVDLNGATKEDLAKLPGIGDDLADKIIAARPFKMKSDLRSKNILTRAQYHKIRAWVVAK